jgi:acetoin:2,6-dichlorophenolindophenol oxidoreductase subunit alpha
MQFLPGTAFLEFQIIMMPPDLWSLYSLMLKSRLFEEAVARLWHDGLISGEMHLGTGEEAIVAGVVSQLIEGDAMSLDHRGTPPLVMRGVDPMVLLREFLGRSDGLCKGMGGHMHLFSQAHLAASSGIVGAAGPTAAGFGLAARYLRPGTISVSFFGEGSMNQGMLIESMNLSVSWNLPVLFICKDDQWAITTSAEKRQGPALIDRARSLGLNTFEVDGRDVLQVWEAANQAIGYARSGKGPVFLHANCVHLEGHFLGYQLLRVVRNPLNEIPTIALPLLGSFLQPRGARFGERLVGLKIVLDAILETLRDPRNNPGSDPVRRIRTQLTNGSEKLEKLEAAIQSEIEAVLEAALSERVSLGK